MSLFFFYLLPFMVNKDEYKKINNGISVTAAADYIVPDWPVSHYLFPRENPPPAMRPVVKIL